MDLARILHEAAKITVNGQFASHGITVPATLNGDSISPKNAMLPSRKFWGRVSPVQEYMATELTSFDLTTDAPERTVSYVPTGKLGAYDVWIHPEGCDGGVVKTRLSVPEGQKFISSLQAKAADGADITVLPPLPHP